MIPIQNLSDKYIVKRFYAMPNDLTKKILISCSNKIKPIKSLNISFMKTGRGLYKIDLPVSQSLCLLITTFLEIELKHRIL